MNEDIRVTFQLITRSREDGSFRAILVEGPWEGEPSVELRRVAGRLADSANAILTGQLIELYPGMKGKPVTLQVDSYDTPREEVDAIVRRLADQLREQTPNEFVSELRVEHNWYDWQVEYEKRHGPPHRTMGERLRALFRRRT